jgi:hypothetical protein
VAAAHVAAEERELANCNHGRIAGSTLSPTAASQREDTRVFFCRSWTTPCQAHDG